MTLKIIKNLKTTYTFNYFKGIVTFELPVLYSPIILAHFLGFLNLLDPDPGGLLQYGSTRIRICNTGSHWFKIKK